MSNTNAQHLGYSPQLGRLTPEDFRCQSQLDRLSDFLRSLVLIPGQGVEITRDGSAGTVLSAAEVAQNAVDTKRIVTLGRDGVNYTVTYPTLIAFVQYGYGGVSSTSITGGTFTFTTLPTNIWITDRASGAYQWVHDGSTGTDTVTQNAKMASVDYNALCCAYTSGNILEIPWVLRFAKDARWFVSSNNPSIIDLRCYTSASYVWRSSSGTALTGSLNLGYSASSVGALIDNQTNDLYLGVPDSWYASWAGGSNVIAYVFEDSQRITGYMYFYLGSIAKANGYITQIIGPNLPAQIPFLSYSQSSTYVKTVSPLTTGTVSGVKGIITGAS